MFQVPTIYLAVTPLGTPCLAIKSVDGVHYVAENMTASGPTGTIASIQPGSHAFVKLPFEDFVRLARFSDAFGSAPGNTFELNVS